MERPGKKEWATYYDAVALLDRSFGQVLARLEHEGLADNTIVIFMGDNGQCLFRSKQFLYDGGLHVPLIIRWPDRRGAGEVEERLVAGIDLPVAILGLAGVDTQELDLHGVDFLKPDAPERTHIIAARDRMGLAIDRMRAVRTKEYKYIRNYLP